MSPYDRFIKPLDQMASAALESVADYVNTRPPLDAGYADEPIELPRALFSRPNVQTEWWYYTGHCETESGRRFGFELVFFKRRTDLDKLGPMPMSLVANPMYAAHFAISDITEGKFHYDHRRSFGGMLDPAASACDVSFNVALGDWSVRDVGGRHLLSASLPSGIRFDAILDEGKPLVLNGDDGNGVSRKMKGTSHHFSFTRMDASGTISIGGAAERFSGSAWMDREYGAWEQTNWDWFSIQFDDRTELMIYQFRAEDGEAKGDSTGTFVDTDGIAEYLRKDEFSIEALGSWTSTATGVEYPSGWRVRVPKLEIDVEILPLIDDQELDTRGTTMVIYWEGACSVSGTRTGKPVGGNAYAELVGYDRSHESIDVADFLFGALVRRSISSL